MRISTSLRLIGVGLLFALVALFMVLGKASAHEWGGYDVTNQGRVASLHKEPGFKYDRSFHEVKEQLNRRSGEHGVILRNNGGSEITVQSEPTVPGVAGWDSNYVYCDGTCRSWSVVTISTNYPFHGNVTVKHTERHEIYHAFAAVHEPCGVRSVMLGTPYTNCYPGEDVLWRTRDYTHHDRMNYRREKRSGHYDEQMSAATLVDESPLVTTENEAIMLFKHSDADRTQVIPKGRGTLYVMEFLPHRFERAS